MIRLQRVDESILTIFFAVDLLQIQSKEMFNFDFD
jgi:hypothetical protein